MLWELAVSDLGVIEHLDLVFRPGMTAVTGETGAGKTLVVEAIDLLVGGRADGDLVRDGAEEAVIEGRFEHDGEELVVRRVVPRDGRSRAYVDDRLVTAARLAELGKATIDLHGQHAHQSLLSRAAQREALDRFGDIDAEPLVLRRARLAELDELLAELGGDARERARQIDLLRFQLAEIDDAAPTPGEEGDLRAEEALLADAEAHREAGAAARELVAGDRGAGERLGEAVARLGDRTPFTTLRQRLDALQAELLDVSAELRDVVEGIADDPERLATVQDRQRVLGDLRRKYGADLEEVLDYARQARNDLQRLESHDDRRLALDEERRAVADQVAALEDRIGSARRAVVDDLERAVEAHLHDLAMPDAELEVDVEGADGSEVTFRVAANPGAAPKALRKVASGGELARIMLALRLVLTAGPPVLVFDEVDAGIGGGAAQAVGQSLASLAPSHQVLVVTHLPQVAAFADHQVAVSKSQRAGTTVTEVRAVDGDDRVVELSRMLSGSPDSSSAREHAEELLSVAARHRRTP